MTEKEESAISKGHPMTSGKGLFNYSERCSYQKRGANAVKELIREEIMQKLDLGIIALSNSSTFRISDLGCAFGPNTFVSVQNMIDAIQNTYQSQGMYGSGTPEFQVFLNDQISNDFNALLTFLPPNRQYHVACVPGSFYGRLFPRASLHVAHSSYSLNWLSQVPKEVVDSSSPAWNKGKIHYSTAGDQTIKAFAGQFAEDMNCFLTCRAQEVVHGGLIVLIMACRLNGSPHSEVFANAAFDILGTCLLDLAKKGIVSEEKVDSFNMPIYMPSPEELEVIVKRNGCFKVERLECIPPPYHAAESGDTVGNLRATTENLLTQHFGHDVMDELFECCEKKLKCSPRKGGTFSLFMCLKCMASN